MGIVRSCRRILNPDFFFLLTTAELHQSTSSTEALSSAATRKHSTTRNKTEPSSGGWGRQHGKFAADPRTVSDTDRVDPIRPPLILAKPCSVLSSSRSSLSLRKHEQQGWLGPNGSRLRILIPSIHGSPVTTAPAGHTVRFRDQRKRKDWQA